MQSRKFMLLEFAGFLVFSLVNTYASESVVTSGSRFVVQCDVDELFSHLQKPAQNPLFWQFQ